MYYGVRCTVYVLRERISMLIYANYDRKKIVILFNERRVGCID